MTRIEHMLVILAEESAEVMQRASKAIRFGLDEIQPGQPDTNTRRIERELADLVAVAESLGLSIRDEDKAAKKAKLETFLAYAVECGTVTDE